LRICPCPNSITNEEELHDFAIPYQIDYPIYFLKDEYKTPIVIFNLKNRLDDKGFILNKNAKDFKGQKILIQNSIYRMPVRINFGGFYSKVLFEDAADFFKQFGQVYQLTFFEERNGYVIFNTPLDSQNCWNAFDNQIRKYENSIISISIPDDIDLDLCKDLTSFQTDPKPPSNKIPVNKNTIFSEPQRALGNSNTSMKSTSSIKIEYNQKKSILIEKPSTPKHLEKTIAFSSKLSEILIIKEDSSKESASEKENKNIQQQQISSKENPKTLLLSGFGNHHINSKIIDQWLDHYSEGVIRA
jgi:hypothetical protein